MNIRFLGNIRNPAAVFAILFFVQMAPAADLDAPITAKPTIRSEFLRGNSAGGDCFQARPLGSVDWLPIANCISNVVSIETRANRISDPFKLGIYYSAVVDMEILNKVSRIPDSEFRHIYEFYQAETNRLKDRLGISEDEIRSMIRSQ
jgi:hypothetical protein